MKYLGLDLGSVTCGVAWSETGFIAGTYKTIRFQPDGERGQICLAFGKQLEKESGLPVHMQDERMTTVESEDILLEADVSRRKRKKVIDQMAAVAILQRYLDSLS